MNWWEFIRCEPQSRISSSSWRAHRIAAVSWKALVQALGLIGCWSFLDQGGDPALFVRIPLAMPHSGYTGIGQGLTRR